MNALLFLLPALAACVVLAGIHTYLGIHVITRGVIFVDIALAQLAALGISLAALMGHEPESQIAYFYALSATSLGALFFSSFRSEKVPQEAIIGVTFAVASSLSLLVADKIPHGSEHLKYILNGNILWVNWNQIAKITFIYALLGLVHYKVRHKMGLVSSDPVLAEKQGMRLWLWNLFFYFTFGIIITSAVQIAGVLLVFSFLIIPALISTLFFDSLKQRVVGGWGIGVLASLAGIWISYLWDLPTGASIIAVFGIVLALTLFGMKIKGNL